ncbi:MAG: hypothetical protein LBS99_04965 [Clostridiales bacterium]|jgi:hypothetical protein|nr:hypothetical protein [Clostridiales bacterium]
MRKKTLTVLVAALMAGTAFAAIGCNKEKPADFSIFVPWTTPANTFGWEQDSAFPAYKALEKATGVKVDYYRGEYQQVKLMLAGGDYPEVIVFNDQAYNGGYDGGIEKGIADGIILDVEAQIREFAPNYIKRIADSTSTEAAVKTPSGKLTSFFGLRQSVGEPMFGYVMREDWLRAAGFVNADQTTKLPLTYADWTTYLTYVKTHNLNNGAAPLYVNNVAIEYVNQTLNAGFGAAADWYVDATGTVKYGITEDAFWEYSNQIKQWFAAGFIDTSFAAANAEPTPTKNAASAVTGTHSAKAQYAATPFYQAEITEYETIGKTFDPNFKLIAVPSPVKDVGDVAHLCYPLTGGTQDQYYAVITKKANTPAKIQKILEWFNYVYGDAGTRLLNYGEEGVAYTVVDGAPVFTSTITGNADVSPTTMSALYSHAGIGTFFKVSTEAAFPDADAHIAQSKVAWGMQVDDAYNYPEAAKSFLTTEQASVATTFLAQTQMVTYAIHMANAMGLTSLSQLAGTLPDYPPSKNTAVAIFELYQLQTVLEYYQSAYDLYKASLAA